MWALVKACGSLDVNTPYAYLMACRNFADTCLVAESEGELAGAVLAYRQPTAPTALFVWQVGVSPDFRGRGLGLDMLAHLVGRIVPAVSHVEATITPSNVPSQSLFRALARRLEAPLTEQPWLSSDAFPVSHEAEDMFRIGPFPKKE
jgi:L-2,4-diaminobutyric acid acetyltransferase